MGFFSFYVMFGGVLLLLCNVWWGSFPSMWKRTPSNITKKEKNPTKQYIEGKEPHQTLHRRKRTPPNII
jgi:hypothetical protein